MKVRLHVCSALFVGTASLFGCTFGCSSSNGNSNSGEGGKTNEPSTPNGATAEEQAACDAYLACAQKTNQAEVQSENAKYGTAGSCWTTTEDCAAHCDEGRSAIGDACNEAPAADETFTALYASFFGPSGQASCTKRATCHVSSTSGAGKKSGFVCGKSADECYASMVSEKGLVPVAGTDKPQTTTLWKVVRKQSGGGSMPGSSTFKFSNEDMARIEAWIRGGAKK